MAGNGFSVDQGIMATSAAGGINVANDVKTGADLMIAQLSSMVWVGAGGTAFETAKTNLTNDLTAISTAAGNLSERLRTASTNYGTTDDDSQGTVQRAGASMGSIGTQLRGLA
ncbi:MAG: type VII secretion target [Frankia sp.]